MSDLDDLAKAVRDQQQASPPTPANAKRVIPVAPPPLPLQITHQHSADPSQTFRNAFAWGMGTMTSRLIMLTIILIPILLIFLCAAFCVLAPLITAATTLRPQQ